MHNRFLRRGAVETEEVEVGELAEIMSEVRLSRPSSLDEGIRTFETGARRSADADEARFDLISPFALLRLARRYKLGADNHGARNWEKGMPASNALNHIETHINKWKAGDTSDDHLAGAAWGLFALMHFEAVMPECIDIPSRPEAGERQR